MIESFEPVCGKLPERFGFDFGVSDLGVLGFGDSFLYVFGIVATFSFINGYFIDDPSGFICLVSKCFFTYSLGRLKFSIKSSFIEIQGC